MVRSWLVAEVFAFDAGLYVDLSLTALLYTDLRPLIQDSLM